MQEMSAKLFKLCYVNLVACYCVWEGIYFYKNHMHCMYLFYCIVFCMYPLYCISEFMIVFTSQKIDNYNNSGLIRYYDML